MSIIDFQHRNVQSLKLPEITNVNTISQSIDPVANEGTCVYCPQDNKMYFSDGSAWITDLGVPSPLTIVAPITAVDTNVLNITGVTLKAYFATTGLPGVLSNTTQSISGVKTWIDDVIAPRYRCNDLNIRVGDGVLNGISSYNCGIGNDVMAAATGDQNTAIGYQAAQFLSTGTLNCCFGISSGNNITNGLRNCLFGARTGFAITTATSVCAFGDNCLDENTASYSCGFGVSCMGKNTTGVNNSAFGSFALSNNITGAGNSAFGYSAMVQNTGSDNSGFGLSALKDNISGAANSAFGSLAGENVTTGGNNVFLGYTAGQNVTTGSNNILMGVGSVGSAALSNAIEIGFSQTTCNIKGIRGVTTASAAINVLVSTTGQLGTVSSRRELKENINLIDEEYNHNVVMGLKANRFSMKSDESHMLTYGLIVDEVALIEPDLVALDADGNQETVYYNALPILLLAEIQRLNKRLDLLENK